jgi:hypothetical protein
MNGCVISRTLCNLCKALRHPEKFLCDEDDLRSGSRGVRMEKKNWSPADS